MSSNSRFGQILSEGIRRAAAYQALNIGPFQDKLAEAIDYSAHSINRWRKGHIPNDEQLAKIARYLVEKGNLDRNWLNHFLTAAEYHPKEYLLNEILPTQETSKSALTQTNQPIFQREPVSREDWGEAPDVTNFRGRKAELDKLEQWIVRDQCRLVGVLGMGGMGKTALITKLARQIKAQFDYVIWRSLRNAPPLEDILSECCQFLSAQRQDELPERLDQRLTRLLDYLRQHRCLLILDNAETILQEGDRAGHYRQGYEAYGQLIQQVGETAHQSCLVLTSREKPREFALLEGESSPVRSLQLAGLAPGEGRTILVDKGLLGENESWTALVQRYSGNPLALKLVSETIREVFNGQIDNFLREETLIFGGIRDILDQQFERLSRLEREVMMWLAIEREAISPEALQADLVPGTAEGLVQLGSKQKFIEALRALRRRSLIEKSGPHFTLQNVGFGSGSFRK